MDIVTETAEWGSIVRVSGCLDVSSKKQFLELPCMQDCQTSLVLDLAQMDFLDSSGLGALVQVVRKFRESGRALVLASPTESVMRVLELTSVDQILTIADSVERAASVVMQRK